MRYRKINIRIKMDFSVVVWFRFFLFVKMPHSPFVWEFLAIFPNGGTESEIVA